MLAVIRAGRLIDGTGAPPADAAMIVVENGRIREVTTEGKGKEPQSADVERIDLSDATILPGLIDCHVHLVFSARPSTLQDILTENNRQIMLRAVHNAQMALRTGVTTVRDCGGRAGVTFSLRDSIEAGVLPGPRIFAAGPPITITGGHCYYLEGEADTADDLRRITRSLAKQGADFFKVMSTGGRMTPQSNVTVAQYTVEELDTLVYEAKRLRRTVAAHGHGVAGIRNAVAAGVTTIEHGTWISEHDSAAVDYDPAVAAEMARKGIFLNPTLSPGTIRRDVPAGELTPARRETQRIQPIIREAQRKMIEAGVEIVAGTDAGVANTPLDSMPHELESLQNFLGMAPMDVLKAATHTAARACAKEHEFGSIQVGLRADLLAVDGDPSVDLSTIRKVRAVLRDGVVLVEHGRLVRS